MERVTAVAVSGGIDSLVAAFLLRERGERIFGIHFLTGFESARMQSSPIASRIEKQLGIPVKVIDCRAVFKSEVVDYFTRTYMLGKTPNPCLVCNPRIKFGAVLDAAISMGASRLATGHYARVKKDETGRIRLLKGTDPKKDQSYFLAFLNGKQLARASFPLGEYRKSEVKTIASENGLEPAVRDESQDVCFIRNTGYGSFLAGRPGFETKPGLVEDVKGNVIGEHRGLHLFTVGQRRGINCPAAEPYYVVRIDRERNRLIVGFKNDLLCAGCNLVGVNWIAEKPDAPIKVETRVRYRHKAVLSTISPIGENNAAVAFEKPESAVTPGQGAVFYEKNLVIGGGWIGETTPV